MIDDLILIYQSKLTTGDKKQNYKDLYYGILSKSEFKSVWNTVKIINLLGNEETQLDLDSPIFFSVQANV